MKKLKIKKKKIKKLKFKKPSFLKFFRGKTIEQKASEAFREVPRITNDTVADHREDVLSKARKYIYPLKHSRNRIVKTSVSLFIVVVIIFLVFCGLDLYVFQGTSGFIYDVTEVIPFPVAKVDGNWVSYKSYLFELRRNIHYYKYEQQANFSTKNGKLQLDNLKQVSIEHVIQQSIVDKLARENNLSVTNQEVNYQINLLKSQNRLGASNSVLNQVLNQYYGWDIQDFKKELKQEMLVQAVLAKLDTSVTEQAQNILKQLKVGANFGQLATKYSQDTLTKNNGGQYPSAITINDQNISPIVLNTLFELKPGQTSGIVNAGNSLYILQVISRSGDSLHASDIQLNFQSITHYINPIEKRSPPHKFIKF
jgi:hypothetical protein